MRVMRRWRMTLGDVLHLLGIVASLALTGALIAVALALRARPLP